MVLLGRDPLTLPEDLRGGLTDEEAAAAGKDPAAFAGKRRWYCLMPDSSIVPAPLVRAQYDYRYGRPKGAQLMLEGYSPRWVSVTEEGVAPTMSWPTRPMFYGR